MFSLAAFVTQIIIFINQQDAHDDGHEVRDHFTAKEDGKKKKQARAWQNCLRCANQEPQKKGMNLQKPPREKLDIYKEEILICCDIFFALFNEKYVVVLF